MDNDITEKNIVKKTCKELGITYKELSELMGVSKNMPSKWASGAEPSGMAIKFMEFLIENKKTKDKLNKFITAYKLINEAQE
ncbi:MAG: helix-turn-helix transcriptional regulator [Campylobacteraceae bacterium]|jgi:transcriptional regulator with XRE-family HTH domain|nr:helix-turn-helix transcriptional regulator [Campylobacteraceae bacterium]